MTTNQLRWAELQETKRHNLAMEGVSQQEVGVKVDSNNINREHYIRSDSAAFQQASASLQNARSNAIQATAAARQADAALVTATANQRNAESNALQAQAAWKNAISNSQNVAVNQMNAKTNYLNYRVNQQNADTAADAQRLKQTQYEWDLYQYPLIEEQMRSQIERNEAETRLARRKGDVVYVETGGRIISEGFETGQTIQEIRNPKGKK